MADLKDIRIIFSDIDGTLLPFSGKDLSQTAALIGRLIQAGYVFVPCTGRGTGNIPQAIMQVPGLRYVITGNGAYVMDLASGKALYQNLIPRAHAQELLPFIRRYEGLAFSYRKGIHHLDLPSDAPLPQTDSPGLADWLRNAKLLPFEEYLAQPESEWIDKIGFATFNPDARDALWMDFPKQSFAPLFSPTTSGIWNVEFGAAGTNKGRAAQKLAEHLGFEREQILAAGDNINDIPLLEMAGLALAPANAAPEAKRAAHHQVADCREDGVEIFLKQLL